MYVHVYVDSLTMRTFLRHILIRQPTLRACGSTHVTHKRAAAGSYAAILIVGALLGARQRCLIFATMHLTCPGAQTNYVKCL